MSGGHFNNYALDVIADDITLLIERNTALNEYEYTTDYPEEIIDKFTECITLLRKASKMVHHIDYLVSGDYSEESFMKHWIEDELDVTDNGD